MDERGVSNRVVTTRPSLARGLRLAAAAFAVAAFIVFTALVTGARTADDWDLWTDLVLLAMAILGLFLSIQRVRLEREPMGWAYVVAFAGSVVGEATLSLRLADWLGERSISLADIGMFVWYAGVGTFLFLHVRRIPRWSRLVLLVDAAMVASAILFIVWETLLLPRRGGEMSVARQVLTVLYPALDLLLACVVGLLLTVGRSPARLTLFASLGLLAIGDTASASTPNYPTAGVLAVAAPAWMLGAVCLVVTLGLPGGGSLEVRRPGVVRLVVVNTLVAVGLWMATIRYVVGDTPPTAVSIGLGISTGVMWAVSRVADHLQAGDWADQLSENILELERAQRELRALLDDLPDAVVVLAGDGRVREANAHALAITGRSRDELFGHYFTELFDPAEREAMVALWRKIRTGDDADTPIFRLRRPDGRVLLLEGDTNLPIRDRDRVVLTLRDVTERVAEAGRLARARERFRLAFHNAPTGMALSNATTGVLVDVNDSLAAMLGCSRDELIGRTVRDITHPDDWAKQEELTHQAVVDRQDSYRLEKRYLRLDGGVMWARTWVSVLDDGDRYMLSHVEDVTEQRHSAERLEWAATHDGLTTLPNRFRFLDRLGSFLATAEPGSIAVLFIDLDNFKVINDSLGHDAGDQLLRAMSERLRTVVRDRDLLGRFGGDEFIVMLRDVSGAYDPFDVAERLRAEVAKPVVVDGAELYVTASIGITVNDREGVTTSDMLRDADAAMYRAKARGRDCVEIFSPGSHDASVLALRTTNELRRGLERGEIVPYYQPIVQLDSGHLIGFEVLARWRHPDRGLLGPDQFLPMAEETGLIGDVGAAVLRASLVQLGHWRNSTRRFADLSLSVNVSVRQLMSTQLIDIVSDALGEAGVSAAALWLEITETALMADVKAATVALRELRSLGLHLAVDDFGTGYSSLTYLKRFPVEAIKVDRSFVNGLGIDAEDSTIVEAVVKLGHSLGLQVVAEGVETPLQLSRLREIGCDRGQGYLFGRPRPAELVETEYSLV